MPDPVVVQAMQQYKQLLLSREHQQMQEMATRWLQVERALESRIDALALVLAEDREQGRPTYLENLRRNSRYQELLRQLRVEMQQYTDFANPLIANGQREMAQLGISHSTTAVQLASGGGQGIGAFFDVLPIDATEHMVGLAGNGSPLNSLLLEAYPTSAQGITDVLIRNTALGVNPRETARTAVKDGLAQGLNRILTISRTEQLRVYRTSSLMNYRHSELVPRYKRLATHDTSVCAACLMDDGEIYEVDVVMPEHPNGRCAMVPLVTGVRVIEWETGPDWFIAQPESVQRDILKPRRFQAWKDGRFDLDELVTVKRNRTWGDSLQVTPLKELVK